jgi:hypothetical protein
MNWFKKQPVTIRAAIITACAAVIVGMFTLLSNVSFHKRSYFEPYIIEESFTKGENCVSLVAFTLDNRHEQLTVNTIETETPRYDLHIHGTSYPTFLCAFYNGTNKPVLLTDVEVVRHLTCVKLQGGMISIEPIQAIDVYNRQGLQQIVPPLMLPEGEVGAIHVRLAEAEEVKSIEFGIYHFNFRIGGELISTPKFYWTPN